ncbi:glycosyltransferase family 2 protein [bacterium]|nr:glycosyltransferase family 2 protein [bacterium]
MKKVSILIPVYNEINTLEPLLEKVEKASFAGLEKEIILVDDCSTDGTKDILKKLENKYKVLYHNVNQGKGAALRTAFAAVNGDIAVIQDADLEYEPDDYDGVLQLILNGEADVAYGSRFLDLSGSKTVVKVNFFANKMLTFITNLLYGAKLTDMETCYKAFKTEFIKDIKIKSDRFDFEPEITAKVLKKKARLKEAPITYQGRTFEEGKKITWKDGLHAVLALIKYRFSD